jgi:hypothetical protein
VTDSLFNGAGDPGANTPAVDPNKNYFEELVGDGKKFKTPEELARGKAESDVFIERLKREQEALRQELNTKLSMEEYVDLLRTSGQPKDSRSGLTPNEPNGGEGGDNGKTSIKPEDIDALIEQKVSARERARIQAQNQETVKQKLLESFGNDYVSKLKEAATALGMTPEDMDAMAKDKPKAFLKLVGADNAQPQQQKPNNNSLFTPPSGITPAQRAVSGDRTKSYYDEIRRVDPKKYWTPAVQNALHQDAIRLGERFFDN